MARFEQPEPPKRSQQIIKFVTRTLVLAVIVAGLLGGYWLLTRPERGLPNPTEQQGVGSRLAGLSLLALTGDSGDSRSVSLQNLKNKVVLLNFWGTWCPPCRDELPHMAELRNRYAAQETFRLLAVSCPAGGQADDVQSLRENTEELLNKLSLDLPTYYDPDEKTRAAVDEAIAAADRLFPLTLLLDGKGVIRAVWLGYRAGVETEMERYIGMVLEEEKTKEGK
jgi:thiol-disulfide isomerase/thioredoxin